MRATSGSLPVLLRLRQVRGRLPARCSRPGPGAAAVPTRCGRGSSACCASRWSATDAGRAPGARARGSGGGAARLAAPGRSPAAGRWRRAGRGALLLGGDGLGGRRGVGRLFHLQHRGRTARSGAASRSMSRASGATLPGLRQRRPAALGALLGLRRPRAGALGRHREPRRRRGRHLGHRLGALSRDPPRRLLARPAVAPGHSGGMTGRRVRRARLRRAARRRRGAAAGGGSALIPVGSLVGFVGMLADSALGAAWQGRPLPRLRRRERLAGAPVRRPHRSGREACDGWTTTQ